MRGFGATWRAPPAIGDDQHVLLLASGAAVAYPLAIDEDRQKARTEIFPNFRAARLSGASAVTSSADKPSASAT